MNARAHTHTHTGIQAHTGNPSTLPSLSPPPNTHTHTHTHTHTKVSASYDAMMTKFTLGDASGQALAGKAHTNAVIALAVAGDMLVSCGLDDTLRAYSLASFSPAGDAVALGGAPSGLALAPDGSVCVVTTNKAILVLTRQGTGWAQAIPGGRAGGSADGAAVGELRGVDLRPRHHFLGLKKS